MERLCNNAMTMEQWHDDCTAMIYHVIIIALSCYRIKSIVWPSHRSHFLLFSRDRSGTLAFLNAALLSHPRHRRLWRHDIMLKAVSRHCVNSNALSHHRHRICWLFIRSWNITQYIGLGITYFSINCLFDVTIVMNNIENIALLWKVTLQEI